MKIFALLGLSLVCVEVNSYTSNRRQTKALNRYLKNKKSKNISSNNIFNNLCIQINSFIYVLPFLFRFYHNFKLECEDTPSWDDGEGGDCDLYVEHPAWCTQYPEDYNRPDLNCCVCGKPDNGKTS